MDTTGTYMKKDHRRPNLPDRAYVRCKACDQAAGVIYRARRKTGLPSRTSGMPPYDRETFLEEYRFFLECGDRGQHLIAKLAKEFGILPASVERRLWRLGYNRTNYYPKGN